MLKKMALGLIFGSCYLTATQINFELDLIINRDGIENHTVKSFTMENGTIQTYDFECDCVIKLTLEVTALDDNNTLLRVECAKMKENFDSTKIEQQFLLITRNRNNWISTKYTNGNYWKLATKKLD